MMMLRFGLGLVKFALALLAVLALLVGLAAVVVDKARAEVCSSSAAVEFGASCAAGGSCALSGGGSGSCVTDAAFRDAGLGRVTCSPPSWNGHGSLCEVGGAAAVCISPLTGVRRLGVCAQPVGSSGHFTAGYFSTNAETGDINVDVSQTRDFFLSIFFPMFAIGVIIALFGYVRRGVQGGMPAGGRKSRGAVAEAKAGERARLANRTMTKGEWKSVASDGRRERAEAHGAPSGPPASASVAAENERVRRANLKSAAAGRRNAHPGSRSPLSKVRKRNADGTWSSSADDALDKYRVYR